MLNDVIGIKLFKPSIVNMCLLFWTKLRIRIIFQSFFAKNIWINKNFVLAHRFQTFFFADRPKIKWSDWTRLERRIHKTQQRRTSHGQVKLARSKEMNAAYCWQHTCSRVNSRKTSSIKNLLWQSLYIKCTTLIHSIFKQVQNRVWCSIC